MRSAMYSLRGRTGKYSWLVDFGGVWFGVLALYAVSVGVLQDRGLLKEMVVVNPKNCLKGLLCTGKSRGYG